MIRHVTEIRVRYADTDQMKIAHHGKYFEYFEEARSDLLRGVGLPYSEIEAMGLLLPVIEAHAEYKHAAQYDDLLEVVAYLRQVPVARVRLDYEVFRKGETTPLAVGYTVHGFVHESTRRPTRAPAQFLEAIEVQMKANAATRG
jgi:acyl-CoA thioester hydrolase